MVIDLFADHLHSLKDKRQIVSSIKDRLRQQFHVALSETDHLESWQKAQLTIAAVSNSRDILENTFRRIEEYLDAHFEMRTTQIQVRFI